MVENIPHPIPYQGSKRNLAASIRPLFPKNIKTLYEPFAGSAAISLYAAKHGLAKHFVIGDSLPQLITLWQQIVASPDLVATEYENIWLGQTEGDLTYFNRVRERFNEQGNPVDLLYLITRCVKNAVRFNRHGKFTQSPDKRRLGMRPAKMRSAVIGASNLLKGRVEFYCGDYKDTITAANKQDLVYMDPPYQGTTYGRDKRYFAQLERDNLIDALSVLNSREVPFLLSYDGMCGDIVYGEALPEDLEAKRLLLNAGRSSQATLNGRDHVTIESLYVSKYISVSEDTEIVKTESQINLFAAA
jgi:DNA adenine methylase